MSKKTRKRLRIPSINELHIPKISGCDEIEVSKIRPFKNHPFKVLDDDRMHKLVESIMLNGIQVPVIVRPLDGGYYEMISGHRRLFAAKQIGLKKIPAVVKDYDDDEAVMVLVDSNLQREVILPSEKAFAYKMRYEAMRRQENHDRKTSPKYGRKLFADEQFASVMGESMQQVHRFLRLAEVIPCILDLVDKDALAVATAVEVSYLEPSIQKMLYEYMTEIDICKSYQLYALRDYLKDHKTVTRMELFRILNENAPVDTSNMFQKITIYKNKLREYFPTFYTKSQMEKIIFDLLADWKKKNAGV